MNFFIKLGRVLRIPGLLLVVFSSVFYKEIREWNVSILIGYMLLILAALMIIGKVCDYLKSKRK